MSQTELLQNTNCTCGNCLHFVNGKCYFYTMFGKLSDVDKNKPGCEYFFVPPSRLVRCNVEHEAEVINLLKEDYGRIVRCKDCLLYEPHIDDPEQGICVRTRFEHERCAQAFACSKIAMKSEVTE